ncbi:hypothetical protein [Arhodomonas sp. AD133]|uniref:hypothetical protein n=1 Tax=Arhodomonas sp. AD133 TaxID=3415009 RepID=UPI003EC03844
MAHISELHLPNIDTLLADDGHINIGHLDPVGQVAVATDEHNALAMLRRRPHESLADILLRLDAAIEAATEHGEFTDEINT